MKVNKSPIDKRKHFEGSQNSNSKVKKLKAKAMICHTSSSSFICESIKEKLKLEDNIVKNNSLCSTLQKKKSFQHKNVNQTFNDKPVSESNSRLVSKKQSISKSKEISGKDHSLHSEHIFSLPSTTILLKKETKKFKRIHTANPYGKATSMKPAIIRMPKENNDRTISDLDLSNTLEHVLGLDPPVQDNRGVQKSIEGNEQIDFLLNVMKTTNLTSDDFTLTEQPNTNKTLSLFEEQNKSITDQSSFGDNAVKAHGKPKNKFKKDVMEDCILLGSKSDSKIYKLSTSKFLFFMKPESSFYFVGIMEIQLLKGSIEILGFSMEKPKQKQIIFSLHGSSHLRVRATKQSKGTNTDGDESIKNSISNVLSSHGINSKICGILLEEAKSKTVFILMRVKNHISTTVWPNFFECHSSFQLFPPKDILNDENRGHHIVEYEMDCILDEDLQSMGFKEFKTIPEWSEIARGIVALDKPKTVLCGGKSVGKSSLLRYFVNKSLSKWDKVIVIDFDLGQSEFTLPGCVSVTLVDKPLLGPNFTHLKEPLRSVFLGEVDVTKCPEPYIQGCKLLIDHARQHYDHLPWFINTMGFTRGFGITVTSGIISAVNPTHVVQIESKDRKLNFPSRLEPGFVHRQNISSFTRQYCYLNYRLHVLQSGSEQSGNRQTPQNSRGMSPPEARNLVVLSYLSEMLNVETSYLSQVIPYMVNISNLTLLTTSECNLTKNQIAMAMNGNLVALCCLTDDNTPNCLGFGIVRAIDWLTDTMYIITPLPAGSLQRVNCVIKGSISLPESLYLNQGEQNVGHVPYVALTSNQATSRFAKRDFRSLPTTPRPAASGNN